MNLLFIGAHIDDIEIACGGTVAKAVRNGHRVKLVVMSHSAYSNYDGTVLRTEDEASLEGLEAVGMLGVSKEDFLILDFPNKSIPYGAQTVEALDAILNEFRPDKIFTHWAFDTHQDHKNTALASISASRWFNNIFMYEPAAPSGRSYHPFRAQMYIDISETLPMKMRALRAHRSQYEKYGELWIDAIEGRARMRGFESYCKYAECFEVVRLESVDI
jgi:LmbE family N-acetylglucosaminyl deacetylase